MRRFYQREENGFTDDLKLNWQTSFHEAGHVAAIYLENKRKSLPPVYFQIHVSKPGCMAKPFFAKVSGGRLVGDLATMIHKDVTNHRDSTDIDSYELIHEADIISFLSGPIAEAKYISIRDDEVFNINLLPPQAIKHYGGDSDMREVMSYLEFSIPSPEQREAKLNALFTEAFSLIQQPSHWKSITALAYYILSNAHETVSCEQAIEVLEMSVQNCLNAANLKATFV